MSSIGYGGDPSSSDVAAIRFWLQDTGSSPLLTDDEIRYVGAYAAGYSSDPILIAAALCSVVAAKYAGEGSITGDGISYNFSQVQDKYNALGDSLRATWRRLNGNLGLPFDGSSVRDVWATRYNQRAPLFTIGQMDNPRGSSQLEDDPWSNDWSEGEIFP